MAQALATQAAIIIRRMLPLSAQTDIFCSTFYKHQGYVGLLPDVTQRPMPDSTIQTPMSFAPVFVAIAVTAALVSSAPLEARAGICCDGACGWQHCN
jgi:hypothetical protein